MREPTRKSRPVPSPPQEESFGLCAAVRRPLQVREEESPVAQRLRQGLVLDAHRQRREADSDQVREMPVGWTVSRHASLLNTRPSG